MASEFTLGMAHVSAPFPSMAMAPGALFIHSGGGSVDEGGGPSRATVQDLEILASIIRLNPAAHLEEISQVAHIAFDNRNDAAVLERAFQMIYKGPCFSPGLLSVYQLGMADFTKGELARVGGLKPAALVETAESSLRSLRSSLENDEMLAAARAIVGAAYSVYALAQSKGPDRRNELEGLVLDDPSPLIRIPISWAFNTSGLMVFWDRCERLPIFDDLYSKNPNRVRFAQGKVMMLASVERQSGSRGTGIQRLAAVLSNERELREMETRINPERHIRREGVRHMLSAVCGPIQLTLAPESRESFVEDLTEAVMERVCRMSFFELRDLYFAEGGENLFLGGVPLKLATQVALDQIDRMVAETDLTMEGASVALENLRVVVSLLAETIRKFRNMPKGYLDFLNPYSFTWSGPKGPRS